MIWQFSRNWALDIKYIDWEIKDLMFSNTQIDQQGRNIFITGNYKNLPEITIKAFLLGIFAVYFPSGVLLTLGLEAILEPLGR